MPSFDNARASGTRARPLVRVASIVARGAAVLWHRVIMRVFGSLLRFIFLLACALTTGGCFQFASVLTVKGDGSGTIQQRVLFTSAALAQMKGLALLGRRNPGDSAEPVSEQQARAAAATLGTGVTYVSSAPIMSAEGQGRDIIYAFTDINQLHLAETPPAPGGVTVRAQSMGNGQQVSFSMTKDPGGNALLRITVPRPSMPGGSLGEPGRGEFSPSQIAMFKQMVVGARLSIVVEPIGTLVRTSSPYVDGPRVTLIDIDFDQLLADDAVLARLQGAKTQDEAKAVLAELPGVKVNLDPQITIEFAPTEQR
jgi:hypothetical protein